MAQQTESRAIEILSEKRRLSTGTRSRLTREETPEGPRYVVRCLEHGEDYEARHRSDGDEKSLRPYRFCEGCAEAAGIHEPKEKGGKKTDNANSGRCVGCKQVRANTTLYGHVDAPLAQWVRLCKDCQAPGGQARAEVTNRFMDLERRRRKLWKGMSATERLLLSSRMVIDRWPDPNRERPPKPGTSEAEEVEDDTLA